MTRKVLILLCLAASSSEAALELSSTVTETTTPMGFKAQFLTFSDNGRSVSYEFPRGWKAAGGGAALKLTPPEAHQAFAEIAHSPLAGPQKIDEEVVKALRAKALATLPPDSQNITVVSEEMNSLVLNNSPSYEAVISYNAFGQEFVTAVVYLNFPDTELRFRTVARKADFENVHTPFRRSLFSWQWK